MKFPDIILGKTFKFTLTGQRYTLSNCGLGSIRITGPDTKGITQVLIQLV